MRNGIAVIMAILGTILVLSGAAALWASALARPRVVDETEAESTRFDRTIDVMGRLPIRERLLLWGVLLLALSAVTAGAVTLSITAGTD